MTQLFSYPSPGKRKGLKICTDFTVGARGTIIPVGSTKSIRRDGEAFFYGMDSYTKPLIEQAERGRVDWYYADNAYYFGRGAYFRVTRNALMYDGTHGLHNRDSYRFDDLGINIESFRTRGKYILLTTQSEFFYTFRMKTDREKWIKQTIAKIRQFTDREIIVCRKPQPRMMARNQPHDADFEGYVGRAWCLVTHSSSTGVGALIKGVPVVSLAPSMCTPVETKLEDINSPHYPEDRYEWLCTLANNQWTREEMRNGTCWGMIKENEQDGIRGRADGGWTGDEPVRLPRRPEESGDPRCEGTAQEA